MKRLSHRQSSLLKVAKSDRGTEADAENINNTIKTLITPLLATFVLPHLLMQLGNGYASMPAALISQIIYEGSLSLSAEAQVFVFLAWPRSILRSQSNFKGALKRHLNRLREDTFCFTILHQRI